ncbi:5209_t:CDS:1, partial [Acaulospora colombiana]
SFDILWDEGLVDLDEGISTRHMPTLPLLWDLPRPRPSDSPLGYYYQLGILNEHPPRGYLPRTSRTHQTNRRTKTPTPSSEPTHHTQTQIHAGSKPLTSLANDGPARLSLTLREGLVKEKPTQTPRLGSPETPKIERSRRRSLGDDFR